MPSSQDQGPANQHPAANNIQDGILKPPSSGSRRGKGRRKHDSEEEQPHGGTVTQVPSGVFRALPLPQVSQDYVPTVSAVQPTNGISSPLLAALGAYSNTNTQSNPVYPASGWANDVHFGKSPPDTYSKRNSIAGSPPSSLPKEEVKGGFSHASPPTSPSAAFRRPVRPNNGYQSFGEYLGSSPGQARPLSMHSQRSIYPPPPHQPQAHFYGAPEIDFGVPRPRSESRPPMDGFCCMFDSLASSVDDGPRATKDVLMMGFANGLNIYSVRKAKTSCIGRIEGLRGPVLQAKILPSCSRDDPLRRYRPLVAVVIHGLYQSHATQDDSRPGTSHSGESSFSASGSVLQAMHTAAENDFDPDPFYQTTVEVFSLKERKHISTLLKGPKTRLEASQIHPYIQAKPPPASLQIQASERFIIVASGTSGEVFIFNNETGQQTDTRAAFKCIGKFWTRTSKKRPRSLSISSETPEPGNSKTNHPDVAMFSLSHRWLAIVPPVSSTQDSLHMTVDKNRAAQKIPGLQSHTAPTEPPVNCNVDIPEDESLLNRITRDMTQEIIKGAQWVGGRGVRALSNYLTSPTAQNSATFPSPYSPQVQPAFPPTHANYAQSPTKSSQPTAVSIIDLEKLYEGLSMKADKVLQPIATFPLPRGCSWVSFAPSGLHLLTVSLKGDVQQIWSLMRMVYGETGFGATRDTGGRGPVVREIKRFTRLTIANIVDVVWTQPKGDILAILTEKGTVHIHDIPPAALQWPPPRRVIQSAAAPSQTTPDERETDVAVPAAPMGGTFGAAFSAVSSRAQPFLATVRGRPASVGSAFSGWSNLGFPAGAGAIGGKVVAAGLNRSLSAATNTVNSLQHIGENRLSLPGKLGMVMPGHVKWLSGKNQGLIALTGGNIITIHRVAQSPNSKAGKRRPSITASKAAEFMIKSAQDPSKRRISDQSEGHQLSQSPRGFWDTPSSSRQPRPMIPDMHPLSSAEIETNAPYQPFRTDSRVGIYTYNDDTATNTDNSAPWAFGEDIPATKISAGSTDVEEAAERIDGQPSHLENLVQNQGDQLVVTTRRKRNQDPEAEFFEDDCEVIDFADERV